MNSFSKIVSLAFLCFVIESCEEQYISPIPNYPVNLELNLTASYPTFTNPNDVMEFQKPVKATDATGYGGILVYIDFDSNYRAFDMGCPYEADSALMSNPPRVHSNGLGQVVCEKCKSVYDISYGLGNPIDGPAYDKTYVKNSEKRIFLKTYLARRQGDYLYITH